MDEGLLVHSAISLIFLFVVFAHEYFVAPLDAFEVEDYDVQTTGAQGQHYCNYLTLKKHRPTLLVHFAFFGRTKTCYGSSKHQDDPKRQYNIQPIVNSEQIHADQRTRCKYRMPDPFYHVKSNVDKYPRIIHSLRIPLILVVRTG